MKQKNFSKVLPESSHSPLRTTVSGYVARFLPKHSLTALLVLMAFLFPSAAMADITIPSDVKLPRGVVFDIGVTPGTSSIVAGDHFKVNIVQVYRRTSFDVASNPGNPWQLNTPVKAGDIYQLRLTLTADDGYSFTQASKFERELPLPTAKTNWGTSALSTRDVILSITEKSTDMWVTYQVPQLVTETVVDYTGNSGTSLGAAIQVGGTIQTGANKMKSNSTTSPQWTGDLSWTWDGTGNVPTTLTAQRSSYTVTVALTPAAGYTFDGMAGGSLTFSTGITNVSGTTTVAFPANGAGPMSYKFNAFSTWPATAVSTGEKPIAYQLSTGITTINLPNGLKVASTPAWAWDKPMGTSAAGDRFLPGVEYTLSFDVEPDGNLGSPSLPVGLRGLSTAADGYFVKGANVKSVRFQNSGTSNTLGKLHITFNATEVNPAAGKVEIEEPIPGPNGKVVNEIGDELEFDIDGVERAVFRGWEEVGTGILSKGDPFKPGKSYILTVNLFADADHTFYKDDANADFVGKYTFNDSIATFVSNGSQMKRATYQETFVMPTTLPTGTIGVSYPIAGVKVEDSKAITTGTLITNTTAPATVTVEWYATDGTLLEDDYVFEPETRYDAKVKITPPAGYTMYGSATNAYTLLVTKTELNPTYNGTNPYLYGTSTSATTISERAHAANSDEVTYKFYPTAFSLKERTPYIQTIPGFVAPVAGKNPVIYAVNIDGQYSATIEWTAADGTVLTAADRFEAGIAYTAKVRVDAATKNFHTMAGVEKSSYFIPDADVSTYVLDAASDVAPVISATENYATVTYEFLPTAELITIKDIELVDTDFIYPTSGWGVIKTTGGSTPKIGVVIPKQNDVIVDNDQYTATVNRWERSNNGGATWNTVSLTTLNGGFGTTYTYLLTLTIEPKAGYTVYGVEKEITDLNASLRGTWATYLAGSPQVTNVYTWVNDVTNNRMDVQIEFALPVKTIVSLGGFPTPAEKTVPAGIENLKAAAVGYTIDDVEFDGITHTNGRYLKGETYTYNIKLTPATGYTAIGLAADTLNTVAQAESILHKVNDLSELTVTFTVPGTRVTDYILDIAVPAAGEKPATSAQTWSADPTAPLQARSSNLVWSGIFNNDGTFKKGERYGVSVTLSGVSGRSFYGVPANAFTVKDYSYAIAKNSADGNVVEILFPEISSALTLTAPEFVWETEGYLPIVPGAATITNTTNKVFEIDALVVSSGGKNFTLDTEGTKVIGAEAVVSDWLIVPTSGLKKGNYSATLTLYYHVQGTSIPLYTTADLTLNVYGVGITNPEAIGLSAYGLNGILTVKGLTAGELFSVHNAQGILIYRGVAQGTEVSIPVPVKGVYFVTQGDKTLKVLNN
jgi:hypothetical protein